MEKMAELKLLDFAVSQFDAGTTNIDVRKLLSLILDDFNSEIIQIQPMSGGCVNNVLKVEFEDKKLIVRLFTKMTTLLTRPEYIVLSMRAVQLASLGPDVLAWFTNGVVYGYQEGEPISPNNPQLNNPEIRRKVVSKVAQINHVDSRSIKLCHQKLPEKYHYQEILERCLKQLSDDYDGNSFFKSGLTIVATKESIKKEHDWLIQEVLNLDLDKVFSHGDLWWGNILYDTKTDTVNLIDFDIAGHNPFPLDLANFLLRNQLVVEPRFLPQLSEAEDRSLCRLYLEERRRLAGNHTPVSDNDVQILFALTKFFKMFSLFYLASLVAIGVFMENPKLHKGGVGKNDELYQHIKVAYIKFRMENKHLFIPRWKPY